MVALRKDLYLIGFLKLTLANGAFQILSPSRPPGDAWYFSDCTCSQALRNTAHPILQGKQLLVGHVINVLNHLVDILMILSMSLPLSLVKLMMVIFRFFLCKSDQDLFSLFLKHLFYHNIISRKIESYPPLFIALAPTNDSPHRPKVVAVPQQNFSFPLSNPYSLF
jgi:hypothetical protein